MATLATSQQWLHQSSLLLEARPFTTKITCRYSVKPKPARRVKKNAGNQDGEDQTLPDAPAKSASAPVGQNPRAKLVLKTVDPASGVCLKYETTKAAEVSRLVQLLGQLSRRQAGLVAAGTASLEQHEDVVMGDVASAAAAEGPGAAAAATATPPAAPSPTPAQQQQGGSGGGGKGKKKKGKR
ncbi:hypothetical protein SEPCBS119000_003721 [Sporothrix epigloea]|uniref:SRP9 domain-containing protein n=1 Tax=Sporothrix epigloea TaxID=1892477 RepID=A0ABP0DQ89_9PEZI